MLETAFGGLQVLVCEVYTHDFWGMCSLQKSWYTMRLTYNVHTYLMIYNRTMQSAVTLSQWAYVNFLLTLGNCLPRRQILFEHILPKPVSTQAYHCIQIYSLCRVNLQVFTIVCRWESHSRSCYHCRRISTRRGMFSRCAYVAEGFRYASFGHAGFRQRFIREARRSTG